MLPSPSPGPPLLSASWSPPLPCGIGLAVWAGEPAARDGRDAAPRRSASAAWGPRRARAGNGRGCAPRRRASARRGARMGLRTSRMPRVSLRAPPLAGPAASGGAGRAPSAGQETWSLLLPWGAAGYRPVPLSRHRVEAADELAVAPTMPCQRPRAIAASPPAHTWPAGIPAFLLPGTGRGRPLVQRAAALRPDRRGSAARAAHGAPSVVAPSLLRPAGASRGSCPLVTVVVLGLPLYRARDRHARAAK